MKIICTLLQTDNHASTSPLKFLQAGCPSCRPTNSDKALKDNLGTVTVTSYPIQQFIHMPVANSRVNQQSTGNGIQQWRCGSWSRKQ